MFVTDRRVFQHACMNISLLCTCMYIPAQGLSMEFKFGPKFCFCPSAYSSQISQWLTYLGLLGVVPFFFFSFIFVLPGKRFFFTLFWT